MSDVTIFELPDALKDTENLPSPPTVAIEVLRLTRDSDSKIDDLARTISSDPALAAKVLKLANSSLYRRGNEITTLQKAMMVLGLKTVKLMALSFSLAQDLPRQGGAASFDYAIYWRHSLAMAVTGRELARLLRNRNDDEGFLCGLLARLGQLAMANSIAEEYAEVLEDVDGSRGDLPHAQLETDLLGFNYHQVGASLLSSWGLPRIICNTVGCWEDLEGLPQDTDETTRQLCQIMQVADATSTVLCDEQKGKAFQNLHELGLRYFGLSEDELDAFVVGLEPHIAETAEILNVDLSDAQAHNTILQDARNQMVQISLGTAMDLEETESRARELEEEKRELETKANTDKLTAIPNRAYFDDKLRSVINARLQGATENALGILMMDVDHFKKFNDTHGHAVGDEVLRFVAARITDQTRGSDFAARYGGEEFVVILPNTTLRDLQAVAERLRRAVESGSIENEGEELSVTMSLGGACVKKVRSVEDGETVLKLADECLYEAKDAGRNRTVCREVQLVSS